MSLSNASCLWQHPRSGTHRIALPPRKALADSWLLALRHPLRGLAGRNFLGSLELIPQPELKADDAFGLAICVMFSRRLE